MADLLDRVFVFNANQSCFCSAVFSSFTLAQAWIQSHYLTGILIEYPLNHGSYDWAITQGYFKLKSPIDRAPIFIGSFVSIYQKHWHFANGEKLVFTHQI